MVLKLFIPSSDVSKEMFKCVLHDRVCSILHTDYVFSMMRDCIEQEGKKDFFQIKMFSIILFRN